MEQPLAAPIQRLISSARLVGGILLLLALALPVEAATPPKRLPSLASLIPPTAAQALATQDSFVLTAKAGDGPSILPAYAGSEALRAALGAEKPGLVVEALYVLRRPSPESPEAELRRIYSTLLAISSLEGIEYWSASRQTMRTFYAESWRIDSPESAQRLPDAQAPATGPLPASALYYTYQRDLSFGANKYSYDYRAYPEGIGLEMINLTKMTYKGIPLLSPKALKVRVLIVQAEEALLFYVVSAADVPSLPFVRGKVQESVTNRAEALYKWFVARQGISARP